MVTSVGLPQQRPTRGGSRQASDTKRQTSDALDCAIQARHTNQFDAVRDALVEVGAFRTAQDIFALLRQHGQPVGLSTVYRHLQALASAGIADVIMTATGETSYRFCRAAGTHHHHLVCRVCGRAEEISGKVVERWAKGVAAKHGYRHVEHKVEVFGICGKCAER